MKQVLITGGDGYIGKKIASQYLQHTNYEINLWVRHNHQEELDQKIKYLHTAFNQYSNRVNIIGGQLLDDEPFKSIDPSNIDIIIHTAAVTRFNVEEDVANTVNREGTRKVLAFAKQCKNLSHYGQVSTIYSSGLFEGEINESPFDNTGFANHYERSKFEAEQILLNEYHDLPWHIYRVATVISDNENGIVTQYNVVHNTIRLLYHGLISILPGLRETPVYLVTGDFVADSIFHISQSKPGSKHIFNVCHQEHESISLGEFIDLIFERFADHSSFSKRRVLKPLFTELKAFESLADALDGLGSDVVRQALLSMRPFVKQLYITKRVDNTQLKKHFPQYQSPDIHLTLENVVAHLVNSQWGNAA